MQGDTRRVFFAMFVAMALLMAYQYVYYTFISPPERAPAAATQPAAPAPEATSPADAQTTEPWATGPTTAGTTAPVRSALSIRAADPADAVTLGGREEDALRVDLNPRGAAVASIALTARNEKGKYVHRAAPDSDDPYEIIRPVERGGASYFSYATHRIWIDELGRGLSLSDVPWLLEESTKTSAVFTAVAADEATGAETLRITKTFTLEAGKPIFRIDLKVENVSGGPLTVWMEQDGPIGISSADQLYDMRKLLAAQLDEGDVTLNKGYDRGALRDKTRSTDGYVNLLNIDKGFLAWTALANKYFGVFTRPLPVARTDYAEYVAEALGMVAVPETDENYGDLLARLRTQKAALAAGGAGQYVFEVYAGPKDADFLKKANPAYADKAGLHYQLAQSADARCCCTFEWLRELMVWLLQLIHLVVHNYGVAIIILVIIIRGLLHPLSVFQQKSMFRMQESMGRIQPKMQAIKEKYANDKVRQNQEIMKLWGEEGVNPLSNFVSFLPMLIQMPILIALWTALNTDVNLRHAPFWIIPGHWIEDLSAPDRLIPFTPPIDVPILGAIPLLGAVFSNVAGINILPILMGVSMWLQQKYMPKPHMKARQEAAQQQTQKPRSGMSPEDQLRQQQLIMYMMAILFPLMFYKMPAGLNLYWMATNIFGICESLIIRRQLAREKEERERRGPPPPRTPRAPGPFSRFFKHIASQAEELQKKADELSQAPGAKGGRKKAEEPPARPSAKSWKRKR